LIFSSDSPEQTFYFIFQRSVTKKKKKTKNKTKQKHEKQIILRTNIQSTQQFARINSATKASENLFAYKKQIVQRCATQRTPKQTNKKTCCQGPNNRKWHLTPTQLF
jgi:hypothetical protein